MFLKYVCVVPLLLLMMMCVCAIFNMLYSKKKKQKKKVNNRNMPKLQHHFASIHAPSLRASTFWQQIPLKR